MAQQRGKLATFMPKPFGHLTGNGCHFHLSLWDKAGKKNLFEGASDSARLRPLGQTPTTSSRGLIQHAEAVSAIVAPTVNSYKRIGVGAPDSGATWSPAYAAWGGNNRTQMIRVPGGPRIEHRGIDGSANPYLAATAVLAAGLDGIERKLDPGPQNTANLYTATAAGGQAQAHQEPADDARRRHRRAAQGRRPARLVRPHRQRALQRLLRRHEAARVPELALPGVAVGGRPLPDAVLGRGAPRALRRRRRSSATTVKGSDIDALWQDLGRATGSLDVGLNRIRIEPGRRPTPAHDHGAEEEIFYVLAGSGLSWRAGETHEVRAGDCLGYRPEAGAHTLVAGDDAAGRARVRRAPARRRSPPAARGRALGRARPGSTTPRPRGHPFQREAKAGQAAAAGAGLAAAAAGSCTATTSPSRRRRTSGGGAIARAGWAWPRARCTSGLRHVAIAPGRARRGRATATAPRRSCS